MIIDILQIILPVQTHTIQDLVAVKMT